MSFRSETSKMFWLCVVSVAFVANQAVALSLNRERANTDEKLTPFRPNPLQQGTMKDIGLGEWDLTNSDAVSLNDVSPAQLLSYWQSEQEPSPQREDDELYRLLLPRLDSNVDDRQETSAMETRSDAKFTDQLARAKDKEAVLNLLSSWAVPFSSSPDCVDTRLLQGISYKWALVVCGVAK